MTTEYSDWLAVNVLNERQLVTFRSISRALKVSSNLAKQMLFDFHHRQNTRKPGSVHATYLISGLKLRQQVNGVRSQDGEDSVMQSDPVFPGSSMPDQDENTVDEVPMKTIMLVKEEQLEQAKAKFENITGMHVYSLQADGLSDIQTLTECNRNIATTYSSEDPLKAWKQYGTIQNPHVRRRTGRAPPPAAPPATKSKASTTSTSKAASSTKTQSESQPASQESVKTESAKPSISKPSAVKRQDSNLFKSFAKANAAAASKPKKPAQDATDSSAAPTPDADTSMTGFSDDEEDEDGDSGLPEELKDIKASSAPGGKSRKEREAELQAMMDQEDEPMGEAASTDEQVEEETSTKPEDDGEAMDEDDEGAIDRKGKNPKDQDKKSPEQQQQQEAVTVENGRRRGRRKIMVKKTVKDEEGYLVTREEPGWESFSEDEPAPKKPKVEVSAAAAAGSSSAGAKSGGTTTATKKAAAAGAGGKPGQGNIMAFFGKK